MDLQYKLQKLIAFRVAPATFARLTSIVTEHPARGCASESQYARRIVDDFIAGRLVYVDTATIGGE